MADPVSSADLSALAGDDAVQAAAGADAITVVDDVARAAHPLYADAVRELLPPEDLRARRTALFERLTGQRPRDVVDRLRLALLALDSDNAQPVADVVAAAADALRLGDLGLSERLGAAVLDARPRPGRTTDAGSGVGLAGPRQGGRRRARRRRPHHSVGYGADGVGAAPRGQSVLDVVRAGAGDGVPADHPQSRVVTGGADHRRRAVGHVRDERGPSGPGDGDRGGGAGLAGRRRHRGRLVGGRGGAELCADGPVRRGRRARRARGGGAASRAAPLHQRVRPDDDAVDGRRVGPGSGAGAAPDRFRADAAAGSRDRRGR